MTEICDGELEYEIRNHVAHLTLNRPNALNALTHAMIKGLAELFTRWAMDDNVNAIVLSGAGGKAFCAGGDIRALRESALADGNMHHDFFIDEYRLDYQLHRYVKPVVCLLDGIVMGGGMGISQGSRLRIVGPKTRMAMPETGIGLFPDVGGSYFLSRSPVGLYLGLTGKMINAADAIYAGLADRYMANAAIEQLCAALDRQTWSDDPADDLAALVESHASVPAEASAFEILQAPIDRHFVPQKSVVDMLASLASETQFPDWANDTIATLKKRSPTLLEVTRRQLNRGGTQTLAENFRMELGIIYHCFEHGDLMEGIRAVILDKDNSPQWQPATLDAVQESTITAFFASRWNGHPHPLANLESLYG